MRLATQANIVIARTKRRMKSINSGKIRVKLFTKGPRGRVRRMAQIKRPQRRNIAIAKVVSMYST